MKIHPNIKGKEIYLPKKDRVTEQGKRHRTQNKQHSSQGKRHRTQNKQHRSQDNRYRTQKRHRTQDMRHSTQESSIEITESVTARKDIDTLYNYFCLVGLNVRMHELMSN